MADLSSTIETEAALPAASTADGQSATARPIGDLIAADKYLAAKAAATKAARGLYFSKLINPGAMSDQGGTRNGTGFGSPGSL